MEEFKIELRYGSDGLSIQSGFSNTENEEYLVNCARLHPRHNFFCVTADIPYIFSETQLGSRRPSFNFIQKYAEFLLFLARFHSK
jgi:hypothetical protein